MVKSVYLQVATLFFVYFAIHTFLGLTIKKAYSDSYLATLAVNLATSFAICRVLDSREKIETVMKACIIAGFIGVSYILIVDRNNIFSGDLGNGISKPFGWGGSYSHNDIPILACTAISFLSYFRLKTPKNKKLAVRINLLIAYFFLFVILSGARKSLIFAIIGVIIYPFFIYGNKRSSNKIIKVFLGVMTVIVTIYLIMNNSFLYDMIGRRFDGLISGFLTGSFKESSARTRFVMINTAIKAIKAHPIIGQGLNTFRALEGSYETWSHNNYLEIMVSGGIFPLVIYYAMYIYYVFKLKDRTDDVLGALCFSLILYLFIHDMLSVSYIARDASFLLCLLSSYLNIVCKENSIFGSMKI